MKFKLNPFSVHMMTMHRWFDVSASKNDFGYEPVIGFAEGWADTGVWFKDHWLPKFQNRGLTGLYSGSQNKIDIQAGKKAQ